MNVKVKDLKRQEKGGSRSPRVHIYGIHNRLEACTSLGRCVSHEFGCRGIGEGFENKLSLVGDAGELINRDVGFCFLHALNHVVTRIRVWNRLGGGFG